MNCRRRAAQDRIWARQVDSLGDSLRVDGGQGRTVAVRGKNPAIQEVANRGHEFGVEGRAGTVCSGEPSCL